MTPAPTLDEAVTFLLRELHPSVLDHMRAVPMTRSSILYLALVPLVGDLLGLANGVNPALMAVLQVTEPRHASLKVLEAVWREARKDQFGGVLSGDRAA